MSSLDQYIANLEKQCGILAERLQVLCIDIDALPSCQDIYGKGAHSMIEAINNLDESKQVAEHVISEHYELMNNIAQTKK
jgi:hypothetical protein